MDEFFSMARRLFDGISELGEFLLINPYENDVFFDWFSWTLPKDILLKLNHETAPLEGLTIGAMLFGGTLVSILVIKMVKFFVGIITGS